jgi:hypothetical protein
MKAFILFVSTFLFALMTPAKPQTLRELLAHYDGRSLTLIGRACSCGQLYFVPANSCGSQMRDRQLACPVCHAVGEDQMSFNLYVEKLATWEDGARAQTATVLSK